MKSPSELATTGVMPVIVVLIRASLGPVDTGGGRNALRMPISPTLGSCFHSSTRGPTNTGIGIGIGIGIVGPADVIGLAAPINRWWARYSSVGVGTVLAVTVRGRLASMSSSNAVNSSLAILSLLRFLEAGTRHC